MQDKNLEELKIKYDKLERYCKLLEMAVDTAQLLNKTLREDNEELRSRLDSAIEYE